MFGYGITDKEVWQRKSPALWRDSTAVACTFPAVSRSCSRFILVKIMVYRVTA